MSYQFPSTDFQNAKHLLGVLGSYWAELYEDRSQLESLAEARIQVAEQASRDLMELLQSVSREDIPVLHQDNWYTLYLYQGDMNTDPYRYGDAGNYTGSIQYGQNRQDGYTFPVPATFHDAKVITNRLTNPSLILVRDVDFTIDTDNNTITFRTNPFADNRVASRAVIENNVQTNTEAALWCFRAEFDLENLYYQFGYVLNTRIPSTEDAKRFLSSVFDSIVSGTSRRDVLRGLAAVTGIPLVQEPTEIVEKAIYDANHLLVITDQHVYRFNSACTASVSEGDEVHAGDSLVDCFQVFELNRGEIPTDLRALTMGSGFLSSCFYGGLTFENTDVAIDVETDSGFTKVSFELGGFPADVAEFFDQMHERGILLAELVADATCEDKSTLVEYPQAYPDAACGESPNRPDSIWRKKGTLAHYLDQRTYVVDEPTAATLPATINPLEFLIENVLRNHAFVVRINVSGMAENAMGLGYLTYISKLLPPRTALFLVLDLTPPTDNVTIDMVDDSIGTFAAAALTSEAATTAMVDDSRISVRLLSRTC